MIDSRRNWIRAVSLLVRLIAGFVFLWLAYEQIEYYLYIKQHLGAGRRLFHMVFWVIILVLLAVSSWMGPIALLVSIFNKWKNR